MFRFFIISWFLISGLVVAQPTEKTLQTTQLQKTSTGHNLVVKPKKDHHFNLEAPTKVKKNGQQLKKIDLTPMVLTVPLINNEKCELQIQTYVCDDKKTFCAPQNEILSCEQLFKSKTKDFKSGNSTVQSSVAGSLKTIKKKESLANFIVNDPQMALALAKKTGRPLFIDFFGTWCPPCNILDETVFNSKAFLKQSRNFVLLKLDADDKTSWDLKSRFAVKGYPTVVLATVDNEEITRFVGAIPASQILKLMDYAQKNKNISLAQKVASYATKPSPSVALDIIESFVAKEDYTSALSYIPEAQKFLSLNTTQKEMLQLVPLLALDMNKSIDVVRNSLPLLKSLFTAYPVSDLYSQKYELLQSVADVLKDDSLKKWILENNIKNIEEKLAQKKLDLNILTRIDLMYLRTDSFEKLGQTENEKKSHAEIASEYAKLIVQFKQNPLTNRGYNLERIYSVYKSGQIAPARMEYEKLIDAYPFEFAFHYNYASVLKDLKDWDKALESALKALKYSYGDNQLRAVYLVSEIESQKGMKKDSIARLKEAIETTELPKDEAVRTHRYVKRLVELRKKIEETISTN